MNDKEYDNVQQRRDAEAVMDLVGERSAHFWECLAEMAAAKTGKPTTRTTRDPERDSALSEADAIKFERVKWPKPGISHGLEVGEVDPEWIARTLDGTDFDRMLRRYSKSERFRRRLAQTELPDPPPHVRRL